MLRSTTISAESCCVSPGRLCLLRSCFVLYPARGDKLVVYNSVGSSFTSHFEAEQSTREGLPVVMEGDIAV